MNSKTCSKCHAAKLLADFHSNGAGKWRSACKTCERSRYADRHAATYVPKPRVKVAPSATAHPLYGIWKGMHRRCDDAGDPGYGGRGIKVCGRWADFAAFVADMGPRPSPAHSIDRADVDGDYSPSNCQWATPAEQARNKRTTVYADYGGRELPAVQWAGIMDVRPGLVLQRLASGMDAGAALTLAPDNDETILSLAGKSQPLKRWAAELGVTPSAIHGRIAAGWPMDRVLSQPLGFENRPARHLDIPVTRETPLTFQGRTQTAEAWSQELRESLRMTFAALRGRLRLGWSVERTLTTAVRPHFPRKPRKVREVCGGFLGPKRPRGRPRKSATSAA